MRETVSANGKTVEIFRKEDLPDTMKFSFHPACEYFVKYLPSDVIGGFGTKEHRDTAVANYLAPGISSIFQANNRPDSARKDEIIRKKNREKKKRESAERARKNQQVLINYGLIKKAPAANNRDTGVEI